METTFIRLPKSLFGKAYEKLSPYAKLLYALLLERHSLSETKKFTDTSGKLAVIFTNAEVCKTLGCKHEKASKLFRELEAFGLISRKKQGRGNPDFIYVNKKIRVEKNALKNAEKEKSEERKNVVQESGKSAPNKTEKNKTEKSETDQSIFFDEIEDGIKSQIEYDVLSERDYGGVLDEIVNLITDVCCSDEEQLCVGKRRVFAQVAKRRLSKLTAEHVEYVISSLKKNTVPIRNMRSYLLTALYNSVDSMETDGLYGN